MFYAVRVSGCNIDAIAMLMSAITMLPSAITMLVNTIIMLMCTIAMLMRAITMLMSAITMLMSTIAMLMNANLATLVNLGFGRGELRSPLIFSRFDRRRLLRGNGRSWLGR
jgi:hypothetical protein